MASQVPATGTEGASLFGVFDKLHSLKKDYNGAAEDDVVLVRVRRSGPSGCLDVDIRGYDDEEDYLTNTRPMTRDGFMGMSTSRLWSELSQAVRDEPGPNASIGFIVWDYKYIQPALEAVMRSNIEVLSTLSIHVKHPIEEGPTDPPPCEIFTCLGTFLQNINVPFVQIMMPQLDHASFAAMCSGLEQGEIIEDLTISMRATIDDEMAASLCTLGRKLKKQLWQCSLSLLCEDIALVDKQVDLINSLANVQRFELQAQTLTRGGSFLAALLAATPVTDLVLRANSVPESAHKNIVQSLRRSSSVTSLGFKFPDDVSVASEALALNMAITSAEASGSYDSDDDDEDGDTDGATMKEYVARNKQVKAREVWQALATVCRPSDGHGFNWSTGFFRSKVFDFFLPHGSLVKPVWPGMPSQGLLKEPVVEVVKSAEAAVAHDVDGPGPDNQAQPPADEVMAGDDDATIEEAKQEAGDLMRALQLSKAENPELPLNADGVMLLRLSRMARSPKILELLQTSPLLQHCRARMVELGAEICPSWTEAKLLVPVFQEDLVQEGIELNYDNIVALATDVNCIREALKTLKGSGNCGKHRPQLKVADPQAKRARVEQDQAPSSAPSSSSYDEVALAEEDDPEDAVEISVVSSFAIRTNSSVGMPANPYISR